MQQQIAFTDAGIKILNRYGIEVVPHEFAAEQRKLCITASDLPKIKGISRYGDLQTVVSDKLGLLPRSDNYRMRRGNFMEGLLLSEALMKMDEAGEIARMVDTGKVHITMGEFIRHPSIPFGASLDALFYADNAEKALLEFKTSGVRWNGLIPEHYAWQAKGQLLTLGEVLEAQFFVEEMGQEPGFVGSVPLEDAEINEIVQLVTEAWGYVEKGLVPERLARPKQEHMAKVKGKWPIVEFPDTMKPKARRLLEVQKALRAMDADHAKATDAMRMEASGLQTELVSAVGLGGNYILPNPSGGDPLLSITKIEQKGRDSVDKEMLLGAMQAAVAQTFDALRDKLPEDLFAKVHVDALTRIGNASALAVKQGNPFPKVTVKMEGLEDAPESAE